MISVCPGGWVEYPAGKSCYRFISASKLDWYEAGKFCTYFMPGKYVSHLVAIETAEEHNWIRTYVNTHGNVRWY